MKNGESYPVELCTWTKANTKSDWL